MPSLAVAPSNPNIVYVGTGEACIRGNISHGDGVYKTLDGGKSWKNMGLKKSEHIGRIVIDPRDSKVVYVAAEGPLWGPGGDRGLYKTTDGGKTWKELPGLRQREVRRGRHRLRGIGGGLEEALRRFARRLPKSRRLRGTG